MSFQWCFRDVQKSNEATIGTRTATRTIVLSSEERIMFRDRQDAACQLAQIFKGRQLRDPLVLAIPRGGVVTGAALARERGADLDVVLSRKLRAPGHPELAIGAVSEEGSVYYNRRAWQFLDLMEEYLAEERDQQMAASTWHFSSPHSAKSPIVTPC
jgi:hypothetical protein